MAHGLKKTIDSNWLAIEFLSSHQLFGFSSDLRSIKQFAFIILINTKSILS